MARAMASRRKCIPSLWDAYTYVAPVARAALATPLPSRGRGFQIRTSFQFRWPDGRNARQRGHRCSALPNATKSPERKHLVRSGHVQRALTVVLGRLRSRGDDQPGIRECCWPSRRVVSQQERRAVRSARGMSSLHARQLVEAPTLRVHGCDLAGVQQPLLSDATEGPNRRPSRQPSNGSTNQPRGANGHAYGEECAEPERNGGGIQRALLASHFLRHGLCGAADREHIATTQSSTSTPWRLSIDQEPN